MINWYKYKIYYLLFSLTITAISVFSLFTWGLNLGIDFKGGSIIEYRLNDSVDSEVLSDELKNEGINVVSMQSSSNNSYIFKFETLDDETKSKLNDFLTDKFKESEELRFESVGPAIGPELIKKTFYAVLISSIAILLWIAFQFKDIKYGISAVIAMFHDTFNLVGIFSILGHFLGVEIDFLFFTALLTTLSFSVHDTIVVYDRIRESSKKYGGEKQEIANKAVTETMVRSLNNSFTIIFMLVALVLLGGTTIKWFAVALLIGTVLGTYSSPFVAVPLLLIIRKIKISLPKLKLLKK